VFQRGNKKMNKVLSWGLAVVLVFAVGCATISAQMNLMDSMKNYEFSESADKVYAAAEAYFGHLNSDGELTGVSDWKAGYVAQGSLSHGVKERYRVVVTSLSNGKSILRVTKESIPEKNDGVNLGGLLGGEIVKPETIRHIPSEFQILKQLNPAQAAQMETQAAAQ